MHIPELVVKDIIDINRSVLPDEIHTEKLTMRVVLERSFWWKTWFQISRCILFTYMEHHSSSTYTWTLRLSVETMFTFVNWLFVFRYWVRVTNEHWCFRFFVFSGSPLFGQSAAARWMPLVEHDHISHIELLCSILVFSGGVPITQTLVFHVL